MDITSHFVGLKLKSEPLVDLYVALQKVLWEDRDVLEFQNILSAHITLYYLPDRISDVQIEDVHRILNNFESPVIRIDNFAYFWDTSFPHLCYISPGEFGELKSMNESLKVAFPEYASVSDNTLTFIPHITLFKIRDTRVFLRKRGELEKILKDNLLRLNGLDLFESFGVFKVNSEFKPEIQIKI